MKNQGFTLIELLVVVLIIGILVVVALPKYQVAVKKSKVAQVIQLVRTLAEQQKIYFLANGKFANELEDLDGTSSLPKDWACKTDNSASIRNQNNKIECRFPENNSKIYVIYYFDNHKTMHEVENQVYCAAQSGDTLNRQVCASFGPLLNDKYGYARYQIR